MSNTTDQFEALFKLGVIQISIGKNKEGDGWLSEVSQVVDTGDNGQTHLVHQIAGSSVMACLQKANNQAVHANQVPMFLSRKN